MDFIFVHVNVSTMLCYSNYNHEEEDEDDDDDGKQAGRQAGWLVARHIEEMTKQCVIWIAAVFVNALDWDFCVSQKGKNNLWVNL